MKVENLFVPRDKCPLDFLAEMGERIKDTWIFLDETVIKKLKQTDGVIIKGFSSDSEELFWEATEHYPETRITYHSFYGTGWYILYRVEAKDINYKSVSYIPEPSMIIRLKMS